MLSTLLANVSPDNDSKENVKVWRTICLEILLQLMTTWLQVPMLDIDDSKGTTVVEKDDSNSNVVGDSNVSPDNDSKENSKGMEDDMFGDFATTNDDVATVKEEPMLDIDDSKGTTVVEKDDSKENSKGMEDDMFGDFATTNDDVATVRGNQCWISTIVKGLQ